MHYEKIYKARFIHAIPYRSCFKYSHCVIPISVGQDYHSDKKLKAALMLINENFASCTIVIADTLQRHTLMIQNGGTEEEATIYAKLLGKKWLDANMRHVNACLTIPYQIYHWDKWLQSELYNQQRCITENLYQNNLEFYESVHLTINYFSSRQKNNPLQEWQSDANSKHILNYIMEECSIMPLWVHEGFHFEAYPAKRTPAMATIYELIVKPRHPNLLRYLQVELRSKMQLTEMSAGLTI